MIDWLVFSRDRPLQLDGLLTSFDLHAGDLQRSVTVLHHSSSPLFQLAYLDVAKAHRRHVFWRQSPSFGDDVREWIAGQGHYIGFLVDDDLFIRGAPPVETCRPRQDEACFSLRLHYPTRSWPWRTQSELDYGYPLALDGHIFRRQTIVDLLDFPFDDPTRLEAGLAAQADSLPFPLIACDLQQCLVGIPANRVSPTSGMPFMRDERYTPAVLLERYLEGWRLSPRGMGVEKVCSAHEELPLAFELVGSMLPA